MTGAAWSHRADAIAAIRRAMLARSRRYMLRTATHCRLADDERALLVALRGHRHGPRSKNALASCYVPFMRTSRTWTAATLGIAGVAGVVFGWLQDITGGWATWAVLGVAVAVWTLRAITGLLAALLAR